MVHVYQSFVIFGYWSGEFFVIRYYNWHCVLILYFHLYTSPTYKLQDRWIDIHKNQHKGVWAPQNPMKLSNLMYVYIYCQTFMTRILHISQAEVRGSWGLNLWFAKSTINSSHLLSDKSFQKVETARKSTAHNTCHSTWLCAFERHIENKLPVLMGYQPSYRTFINSRCPRTSRK